MSTTEEDLGSTINLEQQLQEARQAHGRTLRKLEKAQASKEELVQAVFDAARDALEALDIPKVPKPPTADKRKKDTEIAVPLISDLQLAKVTHWDGVVQYDTDICEQRMETYANKIIELTEIQRSDHPIKKATCVFLGDIVEGEDIFPGQHWLIDAGLYRQITVDGPRICVNFLRKLLTTFDEVEVFWVDGNHGRIGRRGVMDPETNGDRMLGEIVRMALENEPRITFNWRTHKRSTEKNWYQIVKVGNWQALAIHGDQIRGHSGFPWYGLGKKVNGWASGSIKESFTDVLMGHWHQIASIPLNTRTVFVNGSTESYNTFAQENLAAMSDPAQWLLFVHPDKGRVTAEYKVWLDDGQ